MWQKIRQSGEKNNNKFVILIAMDAKIGKLFAIFKVEQ